ncbi:MAG: RtcB family protein [Phycisphaerae bacterium]|nr:RtcB family protein [Phycisphaerae bacterium]
MKPRELQNLGVPRGEAMRLATAACAAGAQAGLNQQALRTALARVLADPPAHLADPVFGPLAAHLSEVPSAPPTALRSGPPAPHRIWGEGLEPEAVRQLLAACDLPVAVAGALMPDAHVGYGLPIGGVLATENAVVPYAVGVDIACRMRMSVVDLPPSALGDTARRDRLVRALERQTCFGVGGTLDRRADHAVMDADWSLSPVTTRCRDKAWNQLGTSGSGNHFVEWGILTVPEPAANDTPPAFPTEATAEAGSGWHFDLSPGSYLALLSHSGSRGTGAAVCDHYSKLAMSLRPDLPKDLRFLAWLDLDSQPGQEYWHAMNLMGQYAAANHEIIHRRVLADLGAEPIAHVENHHNFAWIERHDPGDGRGGGGERNLVVHRKGATPAGVGVLGVIPGSMATPGFVVAGKGSAASLRSASHGAGRLMSRTKARESFRWGNVRRELDALGIQVLSCGVDEVPGVYKNIHQVMSQQADLVDILARFDPKIVKMAPEGEKAED